MSKSSQTYYPPSGFYFRVQFADSGGAATSTAKIDLAFQDASGLTVEMEPETVAEGGLNTYRHRLPVAAKYADLVLKRGFVITASPLFQWCQQTLQDGLAKPIQVRNLALQLLGPSPSDEGTAKILRQWCFYGAWPTKWSLSEFDARKNEVLVETLQFAFRYFDRN
ncbi:MAG: phage tail protein [Opitutae bacterium]|nr:phage tail protein [Opitutae bacterium]